MPAGLSISFADVKAWQRRLRLPLNTGRFLGVAIAGLLGSGASEWDLDKISEYTSHSITVTNGPLTKIHFAPLITAVCRNVSFHSFNIDPVKSELVLPIVLNRSGESNCVEKALSRKTYRRMESLPGRLIYSYKMHFIETEALGELFNLPVAHGLANPESGGESQQSNDRTNYQIIFHFPAQRQMEVRVWSGAEHSLPPMPGWAIRFVA